MEDDYRLKVTHFQLRLFFIAKNEHWFRQTNVLFLKGKITLLLKHQQKRKHQNILHITDKHMGIHKVHFLDILSVSECDY